MTTTELDDTGIWLHLEVAVEHGVVTHHMVPTADLEGEVHPSEPPGMVIVVANLTEGGNRASRNHDHTILLHGEDANAPEIGSPFHL